MDERSSGLAGVIETYKLQHMGVAEAELVIEITSNLMAEIAKRGRKYEVALAPVWKVRSSGRIVLNEDHPVNGVALVANDTEIAERLARHLRKIFEESAVRKAETMEPSNKYRVRLDIGDVDLSGFGEVIAEVEKWRRLHFQRDKWDEVPDFVESEALNELKERVRWTVISDEELQKAIEKKWRLQLEKLSENNSELRRQVAQLQDAIAELVEVAEIPEDKIAGMLHEAVVREALSKEEDDP
jgi:hypothetical protein